MLFCIFFSSFCTYFFFQISLRCCFSCWRWRLRCIDPTICAIPKNCNKIAFIFERSGKRRETLFCKIFCFSKSTNISQRDADYIFSPQALEVYLRNWILEGFSFLPKKIHSLQNYPLQFWFGLYTLLPKVEKIDTLKKSPVENVMFILYSKQIRSH